MEKKNETTKLIVLITICVLVVSCVIILGVSNAKNRSQILIDGVGKIDVSPDLVKINFEVLTNGSSSAEAKALNDEITSEVVGAIVSLGIEEKDIETANINVAQNYDWTDSGRVLLGYAATNYLSLEISTENSEKISQIINAGVNAGALVNYVSYSISDELETEINAQLIAKATSDAKAKAEIMATSLGLRVGKIIQISEGSSAGSRVYANYVMYDTAESTGEAGISVYPETQTETATVSVIFELK